MVTAFSGVLTFTKVVALAAPEAPAMVTRYDPLTAETLAVIVSTLLPLVGLVANDAVTPLGRREVTERFTLPVKPPWSTTAIVVVPELPGLIIRLLAEV